MKEKDQYYEQIEHEVVLLLRRADFKRTLDGAVNTMDRSSYLLLGLLEKEGPLTIGEISELFKLDNSTVSRQISTLHKKELATRYSDKEDARISMVEITENGRQELQSAKQYRLEAYTELLEDWTEDELQVFSRLLTRLNRSIEKRKKLR